MGPELSKKQKIGQGISDALGVNGKSEAPQSIPIATKSDHWKFWLCVTVCFILQFMIYSSSLHAPFLYDDLNKIVHNPGIPTFDGLFQTLVETPQAPNVVGGSLF